MDLVDFFAMRMLRQHISTRSTRSLPGGLGGSPARLRLARSCKSYKLFRLRRLREANKSIGFMDFCPQGKGTGGACSLRSRDPVNLINYSASGGYAKRINLQELRDLCPDG